MQVASGRRDIQSDQAAGQTERLYLGFERRETGTLADRLVVDLTASGFAVSGPADSSGVAAALAASDVVLTILSPAATSSEARLNEIAVARFGDARRPIVPVLAMACELPLMIVRLHYVDLRGWEESGERYAAGLEQIVSAVRRLVHA